MDYTSEIAELLSRRGFRRFMMSRSQVGHLKLAGDLDGLPIRSDGIFAPDMANTNQRLITKGFDPIRAVIGQDVLRYHQAVIDYAALALYLKEEPA